MTEAELRQILGNRIKALRSQRSLSQIELAEKAEISIPFLSNIERGIKWPHPNTLVKLACALDVEVYLLFMEHLPRETADARDTLLHYKKDLSVSLHKSIEAAIVSSLEIISSHYIEK